MNTPNKSLSLREREELLRDLRAFREYLAAWWELYKETKRTGEKK